MKKLAVIAGHNGAGTGACSPTGMANGIDEGAETIWLRDEIVRHLKEDHNITAVIDENKLKLSSVVSKLRTLLFGDDISIDIHFNAAANKNAQGTEVLIPNKFTPLEKKLATDLLYTITGALGTKTRGVKSEDSGQHSRLAMLSGINAETILLEICFCSNQMDCTLYTKNKAVLAKRLSDCLAKYIK